MSVAPREYPTLTVDAGRRLLRETPSLHRQPSSGGAIVEFLLTMPFLFTLVFGTFELSLMLIEYNTVTKQVRDAARFWAVNARDPATAKFLRMPADPLGSAYQGRSLETVVTNLAHCGRWEACDEADLRRVYLQANFNPPPGPLRTTNPYVVVELEYRHSFALLQTVLGDGVTLRASSVMKIP